jgi:hypothetical protein
LVSRLPPAICRRLVWVVASQDLLAADRVLEIDAVRLYP